ncbi:MULTISPECIES: hypothetical protein [Chryseobacterium]|uniref:OstA-like protein n=2 Tax=Chryseobacterium TaxID=59732 RepID=A0ABM8K2U8_9FLAO|nr:MULTISPECIES: hypothetical protein [unclassified Chryseobacterium]MBL7880013.1 hypothetical protein [Chryseobacterium gambrini]MCY1661967.1 hypothetical protein [Chryseobacterium sp. SL1]BEV03234.1 hypothetical protein CRDW_06080 [Chryseobacterium gambrini]
MKYLSIGFFFLSLNLFSQKISGNYFAVEKKCKMEISINPQKNYELRINNKIRLKGKIKVYKEDTVTYLDYGHISSMYDRDTIYIQNSGNAMNPYWHFKECDIKYIRLAKMK